MDVVDIVDIAVETGRQNMAEHGRIWQNMAEYGRTWQNMAEHGRIWQIAVDCRRLRQSRDRSLIAKSVETGGRV